MTAMIVAGSPWMTMDSCAWSAKGGPLRFALPGTSSSGSKSCTACGPNDNPGGRSETRVTALAEAIRRAPGRQGWLSAEQRQQDGQEHRDQDAQHEPGDQPCRPRQRAQGI